MIYFEDVSKIYSDGTVAVESLDLEIKKGEFFVIIGPSGCGKTTTLKMINRLIHLTKGTIYIDGKRISDYNLHELRWNIGYVLQEIALFPHMTIEENIAIVPELKNWSRKEIDHRINELLEMVGLNPGTYRKRKPSELSGGQQQRIGVIRALAADPDIILMDEPFSALDPISRKKLQKDIQDLQLKIKKTIVFVTHDMQEALELGDRICLMKDGQVVQVDTPDHIFRKPADDFVEKFIGGSHKVHQRDLVQIKLTDAVRPQPIHTISSFVSDDITVPADITLGQAMKHLVNKESIVLKNNGKPTGAVSRGAIIEYLIESGSLGGFDHE